MVNTPQTVIVMQQTPEQIAAAARAEGANLNMDFAPDGGLFVLDGKVIGPDGEDKSATHSVDKDGLIVAKKGASSGNGDDPKWYQDLAAKAAAIGNMIPDRESGQSEAKYREEHEAALAEALQAPPA